MNCCGGSEKDKSHKNREKTDTTNAGKRAGGSGCGAHTGHGGCGMQGGGFMKWIWIGLLVFVVVSYLR